MCIHTHIGKGEGDRRGAWRRTTCFCLVLAVYIHVLLPCAATVCVCIVSSDSIHTRICSDKGQEEYGHTTDRRGACA